MNKRITSTFQIIVAVLSVLIVTLFYGKTMAAEPIKVGIFQNKPVVYFEDKPKGLFVEVLNYVAEQEGWELEYITCELIHCFELLEHNQLDLMTSLGKNPERLKLFSFSETPVWTFWGTIYSHDHEVLTLFDLEDKTIGVRENTKVTSALRKLLGDFNISAHFVDFTDYQTSFNALHRKKVDVVAVNNTYGFEEQRNSDIYLTPIVFMPFSAYFAAPLNGRHSDKLSIIDTYVKKLKIDKRSFFSDFKREWLHGPQPYWNGKRVSVVSGAFLFITVLAMAFWRFRSVVSLNKELIQGITNRKTIEKKLQQSEEKFRRLVANAADAIFLFNKHGAFQLVNKQACKSLGYTEEQLLQMSVDDIDVHYTQERVLEIINSDRDAVWPITVKGCQQRADGSTFPVEVRIDRVETDNDWRFVALARDISEQEKKEDAIQQQLILGQIVDDSLNEVYLFEIETLRFTQVNKGARKNLGYSLQELQQLALVDITPEHTRQTFTKIVKPLKDDELESLVFETWHQRKDGTQYPVEVFLQKAIAPDVQLYIAIIMDITQRKEAEEGLRRLASAIDQATETVVITDRRGRIQYVNPAFTKLSGYSSDEVIGRNPRILKSGRQNSSFYDTMWETLERGEVWHGHLINKKKEGSLFEEEATISPVKNNEGQITNFVAVKRDVSREVSLEKQLRQAVKMEAIGTLAGGIAHDFNNILAAILGYGEMAREQLSEDDQVAQDIAQIIKAGNRAKDLVKQILAFSRQGEFDFSPLNIPQILEEALKLLRSSLPTTLKINENIDPNCHQVLADPTQIHQVVMNICTNAKHAMAGSGGTLTVSLAEVELSKLSPFFNRMQLEQGTYLELVISDTGCGMDERTRAKIFDPFFTTKELGKGTGLGLSVVHGIIKQHHGDILVESTVGQGTVFRIFLPVINTPVSVESGDSVNVMPLGTERILLVDDEVKVVEMMERMLNSIGYKTTSLTSSLKALELYKKQSEKFDMVITDMTMPDMTGAILAKEMLSIRPDLPIILCTGFSETMDEATTLSLGIRKFLLKPILKRQLAEIVREVFDHG
jgi:PAS domain S-box-containing protein